MLIAFGHPAHRHHRQGKGQRPIAKKLIDERHVHPRERRPQKPKPQHTPPGERRNAGHEQQSELARDAPTVEPQHHRRSRQAQRHAHPADARQRMAVKLLHAGKPIVGGKMPMKTVPADHSQGHQETCRNAVKRTIIAFSPLTPAHRRRRSARCRPRRGTPRTAPRSSPDRARRGFPGGACSRRECRWIRWGARSTSAPH